MICVKAEIPKEICDIDDELKAIYHVDTLLVDTNQNKGLFSLIK